MSTQGIRPVLDNLLKAEVIVPWPHSTVRTPRFPIKKSFFAPAPTNGSSFEISVSLMLPFTLVHLQCLTRRQFCLKFYPMLRGFVWLTCPMPFSVSLCTLTANSGSPSPLTGKPFTFVLKLLWVPNHFNQTQCSSSAHLQFSPGAALIHYVDSLLKKKKTLWKWHHGSPCLGRSQR